jgi:elongation factor 1-alpha
MEHKNASLDKTYEKSYEEEIRIGMIGNVDAGKSTTVSVLSSGILDDGRGRARESVLQHKHEQESGRTSSITPKYMRFSQSKYITFIDLAGHENYLKTTIFGMTGYYLDYVIVVVGANMGMKGMTEEHLILAMALKIPIIVLITKLDLAPRDITVKTTTEVIRFIRKQKMLQSDYKIIKQSSDLYNDFDILNTIPIIGISNKTGRNVDILKDYIVSLPPKHNWHLDTIHTDDPILNIDSVYTKVAGTGIVLTGKMLKGRLFKNQRLFLGPINNDWIEVRIQTFHNNFREFIPELWAGEGGCVAVKVIDKRYKNKDVSVRKGRILTLNPEEHVSHHFNAEIFVLNRHSTTIKTGYQPIINCNGIRQSAQIRNIVADDNSEDFLKANVKTSVDFKFMHNSEYIFENDYFIFREGKTKGVGKIKRVGMEFTEDYDENLDIKPSFKSSSDQSTNDVKDNSSENETKQYKSNDG